MATKNVDVRVEIQFHPHGADYSYNSKDKNDDELVKLGRVIAICDRLGAAFAVLVPKAKRKWWEKTIKLQSVDKKVKSTEYLTKVGKELEGYSITHAQLDTIRGQLKDMVWSDGSPFPPAKDPTADPGEAAMNFAVAPADGRVYYGPKEGPVTCCGPMSLLLNDKPLSLRDPTLKNGSVEVMLYVHFDPDQKIN